MKSIRQLIRRLPVVEENILWEANRQAPLFVDAVRYRVQKMRERLQAETNLEGLEATLGLKIRARSNGERVVNDAVKAKIVTNPRRKELQDVVNSTLAQEEFGKLLIEAYRMRRDAIRIIADAQGTEAMRSTADAERIAANRRLSIEARKLQSRRRRLGVD